MPISSTKKVSITPAAVIEVCAIHQVCRKPGPALILACQVRRAASNNCRGPGRWALRPGLPAGTTRRPGQLSAAAARTVVSAPWEPGPPGRSVGPAPSLLTLAAGQFLMALDSSVMNVSIATVASDLGTTVSGVQTAITLYTLVMAMFMITGGKIGGIDRPPPRLFHRLCHIRLRLGDDSTGP